jgi:His/Glu/Gln/Arg/opine family amino acid ABC transporter permease subunit
MSQRPTVKASFSLTNPAVRAWIYQIFAVVLLVACLGYLLHNTITNLTTRGITSGFAFLEKGAGFGIVQHLIDYQEGDTYARVFVIGLLNTLLVSALCIVFASILGFIIGLGRLSDNWLIRKVSTVYIETFRNIPPLLQIFFWYFAVLRNLPGPRQSLNAFDLAFVSNTLRKVIIPQALRVIIPAADQPIPEPGEKLVPGGRYRLSGNGFAVCRHGAQPDRPGDRGHCHHHERVPGISISISLLMNGYNTRIALIER